MKHRTIALVLCLCCIAALFGCSVPEEYRYITPTEYLPWEPTDPPADKPTEPAPTQTEAPRLSARDMAEELEVPELVAQLFLVKCPDGGAESLLREYHVGGIVLDSNDLNGKTPNSLRSTLGDWQDYAPIPLLVAVNEEGGDCVTLSGREEFRSEPFSAPRQIYYDGSISAIRDSEAEKAKLLKSCGINVNLAPVCDVACEDSALMARRSLFQTPKTTGKAIAAMVKTMQKHQVGAVLKHFPGYGSIRLDTQDGKVTDQRELAALESYDLLPFVYGIDAGAGAVMVSHLTVISMDANNPASLSEKVLHKLRGELGFRGVILTDDLQKGAITQNFSPEKAAIQAIQAGNDMILTSWSEDVYDAIVAAVHSGEISRDQLLDSAERIIQWKMDLGLL